MTSTSEERPEATLTAPGGLFEMQDTVVHGIPMRVWKHAPPTLRSVLELSRLFGDRVFLVYEDERITFEEHFRQVAALAQHLVDELGVRKGDRVAIAMRNYPEWVIAFWAAAVAGAIIVPLNAWWKGAELEYGLTDSGTSVLIADQARVDTLGDRLGHLDLTSVLVARPDHALAPGHLDLAALVGSAARTPDPVLPDVPLEPDADATIFYTSGTTGSPKGALGTHRNICTALWNLAYTITRGALRSGKRTPDLLAGGGGQQEANLLSVPLFHVTGCHALLMGTTASGGKLVMMHKWDPERALELIERERVTTFGGVPAMVWQVLESPDFHKRDLSSVKSIGYGGAPAPPELVRRIEAMFPGRTPSNGWGMTETSATTSSNSGADYLRKPDSVGPVVPVCDVETRDDQGHALPVGALGELWIKGPNVVRGYWNKPEATAETFVDGWLRTGDIVRMDDEEFLYIVDRAKDMVIRGGENVYCGEVEGALFEHPAVMDAAVFGIPHPVLGEEVGAVVQPKPGASPTEDELRAHIADRLAAFKVPTRIWLRDEELPRNPAGKILKRELRDEFLSAEGRR